MAQYFKWDPAYFTVNVPELDNEHQLLIAKMNAVYDAQSTNKNVTEVAQLMHDFAAYAGKHFSDEEEFMTKTNYEGIEEHKAIHRQLIKQINDYVAVFDKSGKVSNDFFRFFSLWLTSHIRGVDIKYSPKRR